MRIFAIIPAGGKGLRSGYAVPKQYIKIYGKELIAYTLEIFQRNSFIDEIIIAAEPEFHKKILNIKKKYGFSKISEIAAGGRERQDSVYNALRSLNAGNEDLIIVHDAARPFLSQSILNSAIADAKEHGSAVVCIKAADTLISGKMNIENFIERSDVYYVQTPQIFRYKDLMEAMNSANEAGFTGTDESSLVHRIGRKVYISSGSSVNLKITTPDDIALFRKVTGQKK